jgi:hypothetical protein
MGSLAIVENPGFLLTHGLGFVMGLEDLGFIVGIG